MYKLFKKQNLAAYSQFEKQNVVWYEVGGPYSFHELKNVKKKLEEQPAINEGDYMFVLTPEEFTITYSKNMKSIGQQVSTEEVEEIKKRLGIR